MKCGYNFPTCGKRKKKSPRLTYCDYYCSIYLPKERNKHSILQCVCTAYVVIVACYVRYNQLNRWDLFYFVRYFSLLTVEKIEKMDIQNSRGKLQFFS